MKKMKIESINLTGIVVMIVLIASSIWSTTPWWVSLVGVLGFIFEIKYYL